jgi:hypothetical protein
MNPLALQTALRDGGATLESLSQELHLAINRHPTLPLVNFKYSQIDSPKLHPIVRECRGIVLEDGTWNLVAKAFNRFFNVGEDAEDFAKFDWTNFACTSKEDGCLPYNTPLNMWGGGTIQIGEVVSKKLRPTLVGMDESGNIVPCEITSWADNGTKNNWMDVSYEENTPRGRGSNGHPNRLRVTTNHEIFINGNWGAAGSIKPGDVLTSFEYEPSTAILHMIRSSLLGDGHIGRNGTNYRFTEGHAESQVDYANTVGSWLGICAATPRTRKSGYGAKMTDWSTKNYKKLQQLHAEWYPDGRKCVPADLSWIDDFSIAKWFMDDGCRSHSAGQKDRALFATNSFSKSDVIRLAQLLESRYNVTCAVEENRGWYIRINSGRANEIGRFWKAIAQHIIPSMRHKLPEEFRSIEYTVRENGYEVATRKDVKVLEVRHLKISELTKDEFPSGRKGFDIETTTHNYFAKNVLVHNSLILLYHYAGEWHVNTSGSFGYGEVQGYSMTWKDLFWSTSKIQPEDLKGLEAYTLVFELCTPYNKVVRRYSTPRVYFLSAFVCQPDGWEERDIDGVRALYHRFDGRNVMPPEHYTFPSKDAISEFLISMEDRDKTFEGVILRDCTDRRYKWKTKTYVALHQLKDNGNILLPKRVVPIVLAGEVDEVIATLPETKTAMLEAKAILDRAYLELIALWSKAKDVPPGGPGQKQYAMMVKDHPLCGLLFDMRKRHPQGTEQDLRLLWRSSDELLVKKLFDGKSFTFDIVGEVHPPWDPEENETHQM